MNIKSYSAVTVSNIDDGRIYYTWIKYADTPESGMSDEPEGKKYIGIAYNKETDTESTNYSDYSWSLMTGTGIDSISEEYAISDNKNTSPVEDSSDWGVDPANWEVGKYLWKRTKIIYTDGFIQYTEPICDKSWEATNDLKADVDKQFQTVTSEISSVSSKVDNEMKTITDRVESIETVTVTDSDGNAVSKSITEVVSENVTDIDGITTRVSENELSIDGLETKMTNAETKIESNSQQITLVASATETAQATADAKNQTYKDAGNPNYTGSENVGEGNPNSPSVSWTAEEKVSHTGDLYIDTETGYTYRWNGSIWERVKDSDITALSAELKITSDAITTKVDKNGIISTINQSAEEVTINASKINLIGAVTTNTIVSNAITSDKISTGAIISDKIDSGAITSDKILANAVTTDKIEAKAITAAKIATNAIQSENYVQGSSTTFSSAGSFLDLENGNFYTPGFYVNGNDGEAYFKGTITAPAGTIGDWHIESGLYSKIYTEGLDAFSFENKDVPMEVGDGNVTYAEIIIVPDTYELYSSSSSVSYKSVIRSRIYPWVYSDGSGGVESGYEVTGYAKGFDIKSDGSFFFGNENLSDFSYIEYDRYKAMFNVGTYMFSCSAQDIRFDNIGEGFMYVNSSGITETKLSAVSDSGWIGVDIDSDSSSQFTPYTVGNDPCYRKIDNVVTVCGVIKPKSAITGSSTNHLILTLPDGYRPKRNCVFVCQGSNINRWTLTIATSGNVSFARYGTTEYVDCPTSAWLPFTATFMVD